MESVRLTVSGGASTSQLAHEVQGRQREDREKLVEEIPC